jgi:hypothetical protein
MGSRFARFRGISRRLLGPNAQAARPVPHHRVAPQFVQLEDRVTPATFVVTNTLDSVTDLGGGLSLRQAILAANANPGHDEIVFNIPISPSLPSLPNDPTVQYFPIILATTLPDLTDPQGVTIDASTQPRVDVTSTRPLVQLLPNPNKGAFPNEIGAFNIAGQNNVIRGFVITGFPGSAITFVGLGAKDNIVVGNWINTDITGTKSWNQDPIILEARPPGTPEELTNSGPTPEPITGVFGSAKHVTAGITILGGASGNVIGGVTDAAGVPLIDGAGRLIGAGGSIIRFGGANPPGGIPITMEINRNVISGTPEFRKDFLLAADGGSRERDKTGAAVGPGIRIMDFGTSKNLVQGNFIGTDITGQAAIPNHNGIEIFNGATSNLIGNPLTPDSENLIRFNAHDGVRIAETPNPSKISPRGAPLPQGESGDFLAPVFYDRYSPNYFTGGSAGGGVTVLDLAATPPRRDTFGQFAGISGIDPDDYGTTPTTARGAQVQIGTTITLRGQNLLGTTSVAFFGNEAGTALVQGKFKVIDDSAVEVVVPEGAVTGTVQVSSAGGVFTGQSVTILAAPQPVLASTSTFFPSQGVPGQRVTISGSNFGGTLQVLFNGLPASKFTVLDVGSPSERIEAFVPVGAASGPITIQNPAGADVTLRQFVVVTEPPPSLDPLLTTAGVPGQEIILSGAGFTSLSLVRFGFVNGSSGFATTDFVIDSPTQARVKVPANAPPNLGPIQITTAGGTAITPNNFQTLPAATPVVATISTASAVVGATVTITGTNLLSTLQVLIGGLASPKLTVVNDATITATVPQLSPGGYQLVVQSLGGTSAPQNFVVAPSPAPSVNPITGVFRNSQVLITGNNLLGTSRILFGDPRPGFGVAVPAFEVLDNTTIRATIPVGAGNGPFFVTTPGGQASNTATILNSLPPNIGEAALPNPVSGQVGTVVSLEGNGLLATQDVFFPAAGGGFIPAAKFTVVSDQLVTAVVPPGAASGPIQIQTVPRVVGGPRQVVSSANFTVNASPLPVLGSVSTTTGPIGTFLTLTGSGFTGAVQVVIGGSPTSDFTVLSDNQIQVRVPNLAQDGSVVVVTPAGIATNGSDLTALALPPGSTVTVTGTGFTGTSAMTFGGAAVANFNIVADTRLIFVVPPGAVNGILGLVKVPGSGTPTFTTFDVTPSPFPVVTFSTPGTVRNAQVTIQGTGLQGATQVLFNDLPSEFTVISDGQLNAIVPNGANPGTIKVVTPGGFAISPNDFRITAAPPPQLFDIAGVGPALSTPDIGIIGSKFFLNGGTQVIDIDGTSFTFSTLDSIFRVELTEVDRFGNPIGLTTEARLDGDDILVGPNSLSETNYFFTIPAVEPGFYSVQVYASTKDLATGKNLPTSGSKQDSSLRATTNILGQQFLYGDILEVVQNATPIVERVVSKAKDPDAAVVTDEDRLLRGVPISVFGSGFTGATAVTIGGTTVTAQSGLMKVISDEEVQLNIPRFAGVGAIAGAKVSVTVPTFINLGAFYTPSSFTSQEDVRIDIAATPPLAYTVPDGGAFLPGQNITLTAAAGSTFYGVTGVSMAATAIDNNGAFVNLGTAQAPFFREFGENAPFVNIAIASNGKTATAQIPTSFLKVPDPPTGFAKVGFLEVRAGSNESPVGIVGIGTPTIRNNETPNVASISKTNFYNRKITLNAPPPTAKDHLSLVSVNTVEITIEVPGGTSTIVLGRNNIQVDAGNNLVVTLPSAPNKPTFDNTNPHLGAATSGWPNGTVKVANDIGNGAGNFTRDDQPNAKLFDFRLTPRAPQDNRIQAQPIYENGAQVLGKNGLTDDLAQQGIDGDHGIDFVTRLDTGGIAVPDGIIGRVFNFGYRRSDQIFPGNHGRGGINDGYLNSFSLEPGVPNAIGGVVDPNVLDSIDPPPAHFIYGPINSFNNVVGGRFYGPNLLQNFPLLQVVQSTLDRTQFNTALIAKPFRSYRIDYYYNPGFDDQSAEALRTSVAGYGEVFLGSKIISTDFQGNGSILFSVGVKQPDADGNVTFAPGEFRLPNNQPLPESVLNSGTGVVVATATDLTPAGPFGPTVTEGPDGTSRYSFFRRVDTSTGAISGTVVFDKNNNKVQDASETGVAGATVELFLRQVDGGLPAKANLTVLTDEGGAYSFDQGSTPAGLGLPNGQHLVRVTLPSGKDFQFSVPANGQLSPTIVAGETVPSQDFFVVGTGAAISTGKIGGQVIFDQNKNGVFDAGDAGIAGATVNLFQRQPDGSFPAAPAQTFTTDATGVYQFGAPPAGPGLVVGTYEVRLTLPNGKDFQFSNPANGVLTRAIVSGETITGANFLATGTGATVPPIIPPIVPPVIPPITPGAKLLAIGADAGGGPQVNVYNQVGTFLYQFAAYDPRFTGGVRVATGDVTGDGKADVVTAPGAGAIGVVKVFDGVTGVLSGQFQPYEDSFTGGVYVATGDIDGDGVQDIITGTGKGGGPRVQVFQGGTFASILNFFPYESTFRGGVLVAAGDVNGDGRADIVTGTGVGGGPRVQAFSGVDNKVLANYFAYESTFRGGVFASVGDLNGDGRAEIITGTGRGGGPVVKAFDSVVLAAFNPSPTPVQSFFAFDPNFRGGVRIDSIDGNNDGKLDYVVAAGPGATSLVRVIDFASQQDVFRIQAFDPAFLGGVFVGGTH